MNDSNRFEGEVMRELHQEEGGKLNNVTMRSKFKDHQISKLPKPTKAQTEEVKKDFKAGVRCGVCGGWHHPRVVHLDYVGHAALTDRLLDVDPGWAWEPLAFDSAGLPMLDKDGGLWIRLTVNGITRLGYGDAQGKTGGDAMKERIGDALRNAGMRFGAALDLWHKGDLHIDDDIPMIERGMGSVERPPIVQGDPVVERVTPTLPAYPDDKFDAHFKKWTDMVLSGKLSPERIISMLESKFTLSEKQCDLIANLETIDGSENEAA